MKTLIPILAILACANGQYTSDVQDYTQNLPSQICAAGLDCVNSGICVNGVIDPSGGSLITQRIKQTTCDITKGNICCGIPGYTAPPIGPIEPPKVQPPPVQIVNPCHESEDCVAAAICSKDGVIDVTGGSLIDQRSKLPPSTCINQAFPNLPSVCCLKPYVCPSYQQCVHKYECNAGGIVDTSGSLSSFYEKGIPCIDDVKGISEGVCCTAGKDNGVIPPQYPVAGKCGVRNSEINPSYIPAGYGKEDALFGEFPWQAIVFKINNNNPDQLLFQCGGVLIDNHHIVTAAHCVSSLAAHEIGIRLGEWEVNSVKEPLPYADYKVSQVAIHEHYNGRTHNNIALLLLEEPVKFHYHINQICTSATKTYSGFCIASGWGKDSFDGNYQHILKKVEVPFVEHGTCEGLLQKTELSRYFRLDSSLTCAGGDKGRDTCTGDGGGPLVCQDGASGQWYLAGLVNAGLGCGREHVPGMYVNVPYFHHWIESTKEAFKSGALVEGGGGNPYSG